MRIRRKPWARPELAACPFAVDEPDLCRGTWHRQFARRQPLHLELGCGKGGFIAQLACSHPEINYLAVDMKSEMLGMAKRKVEAQYQQAGRPVDNLLLAAHDIERIQGMLDEYDAVGRIYINFCNPWSKPSYHKKRLTFTRQLERYKTFLPVGGEIRFKTDDDELFEHTLGYLAQAGYRVTALTRDLAHSDLDGGPVTEHQMMFSQQGIAIKYLEGYRER
jgi:tRNA (guanine-N7-)-methyltransferase